MEELSAAGLADLAGVTAAEVERLVELGILVPREGGGPFLDTDVQKVRLAAGCEQAGLPMEAIAAAIGEGRLSFAFLERRRSGAGRCAREGPTGRSARRPGSPLTPSGRCWSRWGSPGQPPTSRCARTSWRWSRCCSWPCPAGPSTWPG